MSKCVLEGYGKCEGKITGEHYISANVLRSLSDTETVEIGGMPWIDPDTLIKIGIKSLVTNNLCKRHNEGLSNLDKEAGKLIRALIAVDKDPGSVADLTTVTGKMIERWLLKVLCGLTSAAGINNGEVPDQWKALLSGGSWPHKWGLYVPSLPGEHVLANEFYVETVIAEGTREVKAAKFRLAGVHFNLVLGRPDDAAAWGDYRPRGLIFEYFRQPEKRIRLLWPASKDIAVRYSKLGPGTTDVPQLASWKRK